MHLVTARTADEDDASVRAFVERFRAFWATPDPERLGELLTEDVRLAQPLLPTTHDLASAQVAFRNLFADVPGLRGSVDAWHGSGATLFIEFRLHAPLGGHTLEWPAVDRFTLRGGLAAARVSYFDPLALLGQLVRRPAGWPVLMRLARRQLERPSRRPSP